MPISGYLVETSLGWPSIFYLFGILGLVWSIFWFFIGYNTPAVHPKISSEEKKYIESALGTLPNEKRIPTPWKHIFTSLPMWSLIIAHCGQNWGFWTLLTEMPTYMNNVLGFDFKKNGLTSALPYLAMWILSFVFSFISDYLTNRNILSFEAARKIGNTVGHWIPAAALIGLGYVDASKPEIAVTLLTIAVGVNAATFVGFQVNHIDLAPKHAGTMMGITNCAANILSIIAPIVVGFIVPDDVNYYHFFYISYVY